jgi:ornithine cyclodeaminase/alanine dehydrogenase
MRILKKEDIKKIITVKEAIEIMKRTFSQIYRKEVVVPERTLINIEDQKGTMIFMPAYLSKNKALGAKIIGVFPENYLKRIPTISGIILLHDVETGIVLSMMDAQYITSLRTGATSALATDFLARKDSEEIGVFGAGVQAKSQMDALLEVRNIKIAKIYDPNQEKSRKLSEEMNSLNGSRCHFCSVSSPKKAIINSDIIITATTSRSPLFDGALIKEGTHLNVIGSFKPQFREVDDTTIKRAKIFVDSRSHCLKEAGDILIPLKKGLISKRKICAELGELISGKKKGRVNDREITLFKSVGIAAQDLAIAQWVYEKAEEKDIGELITWN